LLEFTAALTVVPVARATVTLVDGPDTATPRNERFDERVAGCWDVAAAHEEVSVTVKLSGVACVTEPVAGLGELAVQPVGTDAAGIATLTVAVEAMFTALSVQDTVCAPGTGTVADDGLQARRKSLVATARYAVSADENSRAPLGRLMSTLTLPVLPGSAEEVGARKK
jgi:hypothetical protein